MKIIGNEMKIIGNECKFYCQKGHFTAINQLKGKHWKPSIVYRYRDRRRLALVGPGN